MPMYAAPSGGKAISRVETWNFCGMISLLLLPFDVCSSSYYNSIFSKQASD